MARITKPLTNTEVKQAKPKDKEYNLVDGNGLALRIKPNGSKFWLIPFIIYCGRELNEKKQRNYWQRILIRKNTVMNKISLKRLNIIIRWNLSRLNGLKLKDKSFRRSLCIINAHDFIYIINGIKRA